MPAASLHTAALLEDYVLWSKHAINICICRFYLLCVVHLDMVFGQINRCSSLESSDKTFKILEFWIVGTVVGRRGDNKIKIYDAMKFK